MIILYEDKTVKVEMGELDKFLYITEKETGKRVNKHIGAIAHDLMEKREVEDA